MPRGKAGAEGAAKKARAPKAHKLAEQFARGEVLQDLFKQRWAIGDVIGQGGFGLIYLASKEDDVKTSSAAEYVIKIEPIGNGPLFCEIHFYQRVAKPDMVDGWTKSRKLKYLGVPKFIASGQHVYKGTNYRFMVMQRFGTDLQKLFENSGKNFSKQTVYTLALRMIDALEFLHESSYIHADIKASNCLMGFKNGKVDENVVYLVDFGLASKYQVDGKHKEFKEDPKKAHDGTIEFTSIDAHKGIAPSRRGDMEILGYCLLQWLCGTLPWEDKLTDKNYVRDSKIRYMGDIPTLMKKCFPKGSAPDEISSYLTAVKNLKYEERPNYDKLRDLFTKGLVKLGVKDTWKLALPMSESRPRSPSPKKTSKAPLKTSDRPGSAVKTKPGRPATPKGGSRPATPRSLASPISDRPATPKGRKQPATPRSITSPKPGPSSPVPGRVIKKATPASKKAAKPKITKPATPDGMSVIPGLAAKSSSSLIVPGAGKGTKSKMAVRQARSKVAMPPIANGHGKRESSPGDTSPVAKKRKVVRKRNAHLVETGCQTSPGLKKNK